MKREIKTMSKDEINNFLSNQKIGILSLNENNSSYSIPLAYSYDKENIYLTLGPQGRKMECIQKNKNVCFVVYDQPPPKAACLNGSQSSATAQLKGLPHQRASQQLSEPEKNIWVCRRELGTDFWRKLFRPRSFMFLESKNSRN